MLGGEPFDLEDWQEALKQGFDPWIIKTDEGLILRSKLFNSATAASEVYQLGKTLVEQLNGALGVSHQAGMVRLETPVEFLSDDSRRRHVIGALRVTDARDRMRATVVVAGPDGNPVPPLPPEPSAPQRWLSFAAKDELLAEALTYFGRGESWFDMYKAMECIEDKVGGQRNLPKLGCATAGEIGRF